MTRAQHTGLGYIMKINEAAEFHSICIPSKQLGAWRNGVIVANSRRCHPHGNTPKDFYIIDGAVEAGCVNDHQAAVLESGVVWNGVDYDMLELGSAGVHVVSYQHHFAS